MLSTTNGPNAGVRLAYASGFLVGTAIGYYGHSISTWAIQPVET